RRQAAAQDHAVVLVVGDLRADDRDGTGDGQHTGTQNIVEDAPAAVGRPTVAHDAVGERQGADDVEPEGVAVHDEPGTGHRPGLDEDAATDVTDLAERGIHAVVGDRGVADDQR